MGRIKRTLSADDQKAIDVILDHAADSQGRMTRITSPVAPSRINTATKILSLLSELPAVDPPKNLVSKTMARIDEEGSESGVHRTQMSNTIGVPLH